MIRQAVGLAIYLSGMLAFQTCTYEENVMAAGDPIENALETRSQAERLQADRVWVQEPRSPGVHELSSVKWLQLLGDVAELARMLQWTGILGDTELHTIANTSENEHSATVNLRERRPMDESSLGQSSLLAAEEQMDGLILVCRWSPSTDST